MQQLTRHPVTRLLAVFAILLQVFLTDTMAFGRASADLSSYICTGSAATVSPKALQAVAELLRIADADAPPPITPQGHCRLCTLANSVVLPVEQQLEEPALFWMSCRHTHHEVDLLQADILHVQRSRAPPVSLKNSARTSATLR